VPESDIALGLGGNLQLEDMGYSTSTEGERRATTREAGWRTGWLTVSSRRASEGADTAWWSWALV